MTASKAANAEITANSSKLVRRPPGMRATLQTVSGGRMEETSSQSTRNAPPIAICSGRAPSRPRAGSRRLDTHRASSRPGIPTMRNAGLPAGQTQRRRTAGEVPSPACGCPTAERQRQAGTDEQPGRSRLQVPSRGAHAGSKRQAENTPPARRWLRLCPLPFVRTRVVPYPVASPEKAVIADHARGRE